MTRGVSTVESGLKSGVALSCHAEGVQPLAGWEAHGAQRDVPASLAAQTDAGPEPPLELTTSE